MRVGVPHRVSNSAVWAQRMDPPRFAVCLIVGAKDIFDEAGGQFLAVGKPAQFCCTAENVELPTLHHQSFRYVQDGSAVKVESFVKSASQLIDANAAPERKRLFLDPG